MTVTGTLSATGLQPIRPTAEGADAVSLGNPVRSGGHGFLAARARDADFLYASGGEHTTPFTATPTTPFG